jgi:ATP-binding cassette subfamily B protein
MQSGRINAFGTHEELLGTCNIYREIYEVQTQPNGDFDNPQ